MGGGELAQSSHFSKEEEFGKRKHSFIFTFLEKIEKRFVSLKQSLSLARLNDNERKTAGHSV